MEVERGTADRAALRALEDALAAGSPVAMFPEGTRQSGPEIGELFAGAAFLAIKLGVPIVPVGIGGSEHILPKGKLLPAHPPGGGVGRAADPCRRRSTAAPGVRAADQLTEELQVELQRCFDDAERLARLEPRVSPRGRRTRRPGGRR